LIDRRLRLDQSPVAIVAAYSATAPLPGNGRDAR
jgi:hypothetical protein